MKRLEGKVALVTGASRGIGKATALALAREGADLVLTSTGPGGADTTARDVERLGRRALQLVCDVGSSEDCDRLRDEAERAFGFVDVIVNNAGIVQRAPLGEVTDADFDRVLSVNLAGPFRVARRFAPRMIERKAGRIINVSSISATLGSPRMASYCASKWGLNGLTKSLAEELKPSNVFVAAVMPGSVDTDMLKGSGFEADMSGDDVARVIVFLSSEAPFQMTGSLVEVFG